MLIKFLSLLNPWFGKLVVIIYYYHRNKNISFFLVLVIKNWKKNTNIITSLIYIFMLFYYYYIGYHFKGWGIGSHENCYGILQIGSCKVVTRISYLKIPRPKKCCETNKNLFYKMLLKNIILGLIGPFRLIRVIYFYGRKKHTCLQKII